MIKTDVRKRVRTLSGVNPISVMLKPYPCSNDCVYCPMQEGVPKSYTRTSPVVLRGIYADYDPRRQIEGRIKTLEGLGHVVQKAEIIVMGGTYGFYPRGYQEEFIKGCFDGLNGIVSKNLEEAKLLNETAARRCVALCLETRPNWIVPAELDRFLRYGCTRVEIGVQTIDDESYKLTNRGHTVEHVVKASQLLKDSCFKMGYHTMIGLPGSDRKKDIENYKLIFGDSRFRPDQLKIYPTVVIEGTHLDRWYKEGRYEPYDTETIVDLIVEIKRLIPKYTRIMRVIRDLPAQYITGGTKFSHLRDMVHKRMEEKGVSCKCIRCREVGYFVKKGGLVDESNIQICRMDYESSGGREVFLSVEDLTNDVLISLLRLRIPFIVENLNNETNVTNFPLVYSGSKSSKINDPEHKPHRAEINANTGLIREIHTYGNLAEIGKAGEFQHRGFGKKLMREAEQIALEMGMNKMIVIAGVGVREYFRKLGYQNDGAFVSKNLFTCCKKHL